MSTVYEDKKRLARDTLHFQLSEAILGPKRPRADTGQDPPTFHCMAAVLDGMTLGDVYAPLMPYGADEHKAGWKGSRCKLRTERTLHMYLHQLRTSNSRQVLASRYGIDQAAVCRHLWRIEHAPGFLGMMPTADTMSGEIVVSKTRDSSEPAPGCASAPRRDPRVHGQFLLEVWPPCGGLSPAADRAPYF